jgi:hypothetical protein
MYSLILFGAILPLNVSSASADDFPRKIKPVVTWTGTDSKQAEELFARCSSPEDWRAIWHKHCGGDKNAAGLSCPKVDFDGYMVLALFHGSSSQNHGIKLIELIEKKSCLHVRYRPEWYQIGFFAGMPEVDWKKLDTQSFVFAVLPTSKKAIVLEEDVQHLIGHPPVWKERSKIAAVGKK